MEIIPTQKIINRDGIKAVKNGQKANKHASVPNQKKPEWIRVKATFDKNFQCRQTTSPRQTPEHCLRRGYVPKYFRVLVGWHSHFYVNGLCLHQGLQILLC